MTVAWGGRSGWTLTGATPTISRPPMLSDAKNLIRAALLTVAVALLVAAPAAFAASSSQDAYAGQGGSVQTEIVPGGSNGAGANQSTGAPTGSVASKSSLPFTGLDLAFVLTAGVALLLAGAGLRRLTRRHRGQSIA